MFTNFICFAIGVNVGLIITALCVAASRAERND